MKGIKVIIHNPNTEEENFKLASYLFMTGNLPMAIDAVNQELNGSIDVDKAVDKQIAV